MGGRDTSRVADLIRVLRKRRWGGGMNAWALRVSPAVVHIAPSMEMVARRCADVSRWVSFTIPALFLVAVFEKWGSVYHTSAA